MSESDVTLQDLLVHQAWVRALARSLLRGAGEADDIEQATWVAALERPPSHGRNLRAWLGRVVRRRRLDLHRAEARRINRERKVLPRSTEDGPDVLLMRGELRARLAQEVLGLKEPYRSTLLLRFYEDVEPKEIARIQGVPLATIRTRQRRALQQLRERLAGPYGDIRRVLAPIIGSSPPVVGLLGTGALVAATKTKLWAVLIAGVALMATSLAWITLDPGGSPVDRAPSGTTIVEGLGHTGTLGPPVLTGNPLAGEPGNPSTAGPHASGGKWDVRDGAAVSAGEIIGFVKDEKGRPMSRVAAVLQAQGTDTEQRITTTDSDGRFHFDGVAEPSRVLLLHYAEAKLRRRVRTGARTIAITLTIDLILPKGVKVQRAANPGVLGGTVSDAMGVALPGCEVRLLDEGGRDTLQEEVTDEAGEFRFQNLDEGVHALFFLAETTRLFTRARVGQWLSVALRTPKPLKGVVVAGDTEEAAEGVLVEVFQEAEPDSAHRYTRTDENGAFSFSVPDGDWRLIAGKFRGPIADGPASEFLPKDVGAVVAGTTDLRIALKRGGEIAGELRGPKGGRWTEGAIVRAMPVSPEGAIDYKGARRVRARTDGTFRIPGLTGSVNALSVTAASDGQAVFAHLPRVTVGVTGMIVDLREGLPISIKLTDSAGDPVDVVGGWIQARPSGSEPGGPQSVSARRREDGLYVTPALDPSLSYVVQAGGFRGYVTGETDPVRAGDKDVVVRFPGARFTGRLLDTGGEPVAQVRLEAWAVGTYIPTGAWTETGDDGAFLLPGAPQGVVHVVALVGGKRVTLGKHRTPMDDVTLRLP